MTVSEGLLRRFNVKSVRFVRKVIKLGLIVRAAVNPLSANPTKWSNRLKQFVGNMPTNCLSVFDHFVGLALKGLRHRCVLRFGETATGEAANGGIVKKKGILRNLAKFSQCFFLE